MYLSRLRPKSIPLGMFHFKSCFPCTLEAYKLILRVSTSDAVGNTPQAIINAVNMDSEKAQQVGFRKIDRPSQACSRPRRMAMGTVWLLHPDQSGASTRTA